MESEVKMMVIKTTFVMRMKNEVMIFFEVECVV